VKIKSIQYIKLFLLLLKAIFRLLILLIDMHLTLWHNWFKCVYEYYILFLDKIGEAIEDRNNG